MHVLIILYALTGSTEDKLATYQTVAECEYNMHVRQSNDDVISDGITRSYDCRTEQVEF